MNLIIKYRWGPSSIETTIPLSNFKSKQIFGIFIALQKYLKSFEAPQAPHFFFLTATQKSFLISSYHCR